MESLSCFRPDLPTNGEEGPISFLQVADREVISAIRCQMLLQKWGRLWYRHPAYTEPCINSHAWDTPQEMTQGPCRLPPSPALTWNFPSSSVLSYRLPFGPTGVSPASQQLQRVSALAGDASFLCLLIFVISEALKKLQKAGLLEAMVGKLSACAPSSVSSGQRLLAMGERLAGLGGP